jgi:hypothetical protein
MKPKLLFFSVFIFTTDYINNLIKDNLFSIQKQVRFRVNYPTTKDGWASGITDSPNGNASSCFCLMSASIP